MSPTRWTTLVAISAFVAAFTCVGAWVVVRRGGQVSETSWLVVGVELLIAAVVLALGWTVRQYQHGRRPDLDPVRAARIAALAKAACYTGALLLGWYGGQCAYLALDLVVPGNGRRAIAAGLAGLAAVVLAAAFAFKAQAAIPAHVATEASADPAAPVADNAAFHSTRFFSAFLTAARAREAVFAALLVAGLVAQAAAFALVADAAGFVVAR